MFHDLFTMDRYSNIVVLLIPNEPPQPVSFAETIDKPFAVFIGTPRQIACHPDIECSVWLMIDDVNEAACHIPIKQDVDVRDKRGHDGDRGKLEAKISNKINA